MEIDAKGKVRGGMQAGGIGNGGGFSVRIGAGVGVSAGVGAGAVGNGAGAIGGAEQGASALQRWAEGPAYKVEISAEGRALAYGGGNALNGASGASGLNGTGGASGLNGAGGASGTGECQTCATRQYMDDSDDGSVSFQSPTTISPESAAALVSTHEGEHVAHNQQDAQREGRKVVSQTVQIHTAICPECGKTYVSGGTTRTVTSGPAEGAATVSDGAGTGATRMGTAAVGGLLDIAA